MVGRFQRLEDQLTMLTTDFDAAQMGFSPDRADAMTWAISELMEGGSESKVFFMSVDMGRGPVNQGYRQW